MKAPTTPELNPPAWTRSEVSKREAVQAMFAQIAPGYDRLNGQMSLNLHHRWRSFAASFLKLSPNDSVLDLCSGTGDFLKPLRALVGPGGTLVGADFCKEMLELARPKDASASLVTADACRLPFAGSSFDGVSVGWGIRNVADIDGVHAEVFRVLKPGGRFVSIDMAVPKNKVAGWLAKSIERHLLPYLGGRMGFREAYEYLAKSTAAFRSREGLKESMCRAGFTDVSYRDLFFGGICIHVGTKGGPS